MWILEWGNVKQWATGKGYELMESSINSISFLVLQDRCNQNEHPVPWFIHFFEVVQTWLPEEGNKEDPPPTPQKNTATKFERLPGATKWTTLEL